MAFSVTQRVISSEDMIYSYCDDFCRKAKLLYNAALFRIRQVFTGWDKGDNRTPLEQSVFDEIECAKEAYGKFSCRRVLSYPSLDKILRANKNPDFFILRRERHYNEPDKAGKVHVKTFTLPTVSFTSL